MKQETLSRLAALCPEEIRKGLQVRASAQKLQLCLYGDIEPDVTDTKTGNVTESKTSANYFRKVLDTFSDVSEIDLFINSTGGFVSEGIPIYTMLKRHSARVNVYIDGFACSMASAIAMAGDTVTMGSNAMMMIHNPWLIVKGNPEELRKAADDLEKQAEAVRQSYLLKSNGKLTEKELIQMLNNETFLTAQDCLKYGLCDSVEDFPAPVAQEEKRQPQGWYF